MLCVVLAGNQVEGPAFKLPAWGTPASGSATT